MHKDPYLGGLFLPFLKFLVIFFIVRFYFSFQTFAIKN